MKLKHIHIDNYKVFKDFDIDFCLKGKPQSLIVISGDNGSGKTTLFRDIISGIVITNKSKSIITAQEDNNIYTFTLPAQSETEEEKYIKNFSKVRFYPTDTNISATQLQDKILSYVDKLVYEDSKTNFEAYAEIQSLIDNIFKGFDLQISFKGISQNKQFVFVNPAKEEFGIEGLSNGEQQILSKVFVLFIETIKDHVILIDNLEKSLHPVWQIRILSVLRSYAKSHDCQIMVITQSPLIIASAHKEEIRFFIRENDGFVKAKALNDSKLSANSVY